MDVLDASLTWNAHIDYLIDKIRERLAMLGRIDLILNTRHDFVCTQGLTGCGFSGGKQLTKFANARNHVRVSLFQKMKSNLS